MFTGIVEETGVITSLTPGDQGIRLEVGARICARGTKAGDSIAVNGCCLTVVRLTGPTRRRFVFDLLNETWERTSFAQLKVGSSVNLERALAAKGRFGGHFVSGHVDGTGTIRRWEPVGADHVLEVDTPADLRRYLVPKGSIAVDGISLTVAAVTRRGFRIWIIPHTFAVTSLRERRVGECVNLEADLLGKYVERFLAARLPATAPSRPAKRTAGNRR